MADFSLNDQVAGEVAALYSFPRFGHLWRRRCGRSTLPNELGNVLRPPWRSDRTRTRLALSWTDDRDYFYLLALVGSTPNSSCEAALRLSFFCAHLGRVSEMNVIAIAITYLGHETIR